MIERSGGPGPLTGGRITIPMNPASAIVSAGWLDFSVDGNAHLDVWYQKVGSGVSESHADVNGPTQIFQEPKGIPAGTMMITYHVVNATGPWGLTVELKAK